MIRVPSGVDASLPAQYHGRRGFTRLLADIPLRVSVTGTRGKSGLVRLCEEQFRQRGYRTYAKVTGIDPVSIKNGVVHQIPRRKEHHYPILDENLVELKKFWPMDVAILENHAITAYTMRVFNHRFCRPHYVLLTNVRRDHLGSLARALPLAAKAFARSVPKGSAVISGETDEELARVLREEVLKAGASFLDAAPRQSGLHPPGYESATILNALLHQVTGYGLDLEEVRRLESRLSSVFHWELSVLPDVWWFDGAKVNDVDSTLLVFRFLQKSDPRPTSFIAYFRADRRDRTASFVQFLTQALAEGWCRRAFLAGHGAGAAARRLGKWKSQVYWFRDDLAEVSRLLGLVARECRGEAVMTISNARPPFPRAVAAGLQSTKELPNLVVASHSSPTK